MRAFSRKVMVQHLLDCLSGPMKGLSLFYQPIRGLSDHQVLQWEGLIRWDHDVLGPIAPSRIMDLVRHGKAELRLLAWAVETACATLARHPDLRLSINMHASLLSEPEPLLAALTRAIRTHGIDPEQLEIEITEAEIYPIDPVARACFRAIQGLGLSLSLDDFGSGYAGLSVLKAFNFDRVKLDRSFLATAPGDARSISIIKGIVELCRALDTPLIAEGIETEQQLAFIKDLRVKWGQGFLLGMPAPVDQVADFSARHADFTDTAAGRARASN